MNYQDLIDDEFSRNIGLLSEEEQKKLLSSQVSAVGAGGVGGLHILTLARLGVGKFHIADPDTFEAANVSRQFGASKRSYGKNKAEVLAEMVRDINPQAEIRAYTEGVTDDNLDEFLDGSTALVDGIDFFQFEMRRKLFIRAREKGIYAITCAPLGFGSTLQVFSPQGMDFDTYFGIRENDPDEKKLAAFASGLAPYPYHLKYLDLSKVDMAAQKGPAVAPACTLAASLLTTEAVKIITGSQPIYPVPHYIQIDMYRRKLKKGFLLFGGKNPIQMLKTYLIYEKLKESMKGK
ncbi:Molybdopterin or thiamine biosynthesis adenylyltransferase [Malonomonas rubra DSM 5091]|uniref:Molybdopterin or thiamine biosynthesis adenylyltransferase n=1 Tax=Malonomonas rubra DSM 5091 TaxID=1122189 RepID=A0A1M6KFA4_MALRU|nr:ThiF family adenylyltransferase [Malonomonas rubra]SHJ57580.1 Molybdopterin or thiamine biosynthesis adenylyltransferase [Malonomonas rubra DSM 5091]